MVRYEYGIFVPCGGCVVHLYRRQDVVFPFPGGVGDSVVLAVVGVVDGGASNARQSRSWPSSPCGRCSRCSPPRISAWLPPPRRSLSLISNSISCVTSPTPNERLLCPTLAFSTTVSVPVRQLVALAFCPLKNPMSTTLPWLPSTPLITKNLTPLCPARLPRCPPPCAPA